MRTVSPEHECQTLINKQFSKSRTMRSSYTCRYRNELVIATKPVILASA